MISLKSRQDGFRLLFPKEFLLNEITEKYSPIIKERRGYYMRPIDFLNETIQSVDVLGFNNAVVEQNQPPKGNGPIRRDVGDKPSLHFNMPDAPFNYRSAVSPISLTDQTLNINFRHTLGFLNYFMLFENFWNWYARETKYSEIIQYFNIDILNEKGCVYSRVVLEHPMLNSMDMLSFNYTQPVAQSQTFKVEFKYSNFDYQFLDIKDEEYLDRFNYGNS